MNSGVGYAAKDLSVVSFIAWETKDAFQGQGAFDLGQSSSCHCKAISLQRMLHLNWEFQDHYLNSHLGQVILYLKVMIHWATLWAMLPCDDAWALSHWEWATNFSLVTLDRNLFPIHNGKVPRHHRSVTLLKKLPSVPSPLVDPLVKGPRTIFLVVSQTTAFCDLYTHKRVASSSDGSKTFKRKRDCLRMRQRGKRTGISWRIKL